MCKKNYVFILLLFGYVLNAQVYELEKVTKEELEQKSHPLEPDASACVLYEKGTTFMDYNDNDGFVLVTEVEVKIKIYKKEGFDFANKMISYYIGSKPNESVEFSKANTYNLVNEVVEKTKLKSEGEFMETKNKYWAQKKIVMPNIREGSIIEYKYVIKSPFYSNFPVWRFQYTIPVNYSKFTTRIPEYYTYKANYRGYVFPKREESQGQKSVSFREVNSSRNHMGSASASVNKVHYTENIAVYTAEKMPSMKEEEYIGNIKNYTSSVEHELSAVQYPNQIRENFSLTWDDVVKNIYESADFGGELKKNGYFEEDIKALVSGIENKEEKIALIFNFVKERMNWNEYTGYSTIDGVRKAYKDKTGNIAEINLMLTSMLRYAGINANPVLVSTRSNGIAIFPNRTAFNYVITAVEVQNNVILLDAADKNSLPNILPIRVLNWNGRLIRENGSSTEVDLMPKCNSKDVITLIATIDKDGKIVGKSRDQYFDYNAFIYRGNFNGVSKESYIEKLENRYKGIEIDEYTTVNEKDLSKPVVESFSFIHNGLSEIVGDKIYFSPLLYYTQNENPFKQEKREYPIDFVFPHQDKYTFTINIPEGYIVESLPKPISVGMEENLGSFKFNITNSGNQIQVSSTLDINQAMISQVNYEMLKSFYKQIIEKQNEKVVLRKV